MSVKRKELTDEQRGKNGAQRAEGAPLLLSQHLASEGNGNKNQTTVIEVGGGDPPRKTLGDRAATNGAHIINKEKTFTVHAPQMELSNVGNNASVHSERAATQPAVYYDEEGKLLTGYALQNKLSVIANTNFIDKETEGMQPVKYKPSDLFPPPPVSYNNTPLTNTNRVGKTLANAAGAAGAAAAGAGCVVVRPIKKLVGELLIAGVKITLVLGPFAAAYITTGSLAGFVTLVLLWIFEFYKGFGEDVIWRKFGTSADVCVLLLAIIHTMLFTVTNTSVFSGCPEWLPDLYLSCPWLLVVLAELIYLVFLSVNKLHKFVEDDRIDIGNGLSAVEDSNAHTKVVFRKYDQLYLNLTFFICCAARGAIIWYWNMYTGPLYNNLTTTYILAADLVVGQWIMFSIGKMQIRHGHRDPWKGSGYTGQWQAWGVNHAQWKGGGGMVVIYCYIQIVSMTQFGTLAIIMTVCFVVLLLIASSFMREDIVGKQKESQKDASASPEEEKARTATEKALVEQRKELGAIELAEEEASAKILRTGGEEGRLQVVQDPTCGVFGNVFVSFFAMLFWGVVETVRDAFSFTRDIREGHSNASLSFVFIAGVVYLFVAASDTWYTTHMTFPSVIVGLTTPAYDFIQGDGSLFFEITNRPDVQAFIEPVATQFALIRQKIANVIEVSLPEITMGSQGIDATIIPATDPFLLLSLLPPAAIAFVVAMQAFPSVLEEIRSTTFWATAIAGVTSSLVLTQVIGDTGPVFWYLALPVIHWVYSDCLSASDSGTSCIQRSYTRTGRLSIIIYIVLIVVCILQYCAAQHRQDNRVEYRRRLMALRQYNSRTTKGKLTTVEYETQLSAPFITQYEKDALIQKGKNHSTCWLFARDFWNYVTSLSFLTLAGAVFVFIFAFFVGGQPFSKFAPVPIPVSSDYWYQTTLDQQIANVAIQMGSMISKQLGRYLYAINVIPYLLDDIGDIPGIPSWLGDALNFVGGAFSAIVSPVVSWLLGLLATAMTFTFDTVVIPLFEATGGPAAAAVLAIVRVLTNLPGVLPDSFLSFDILTQLQNDLTQLKNIENVFVIPSWVPWMLLGLACFLVVLGMFTYRWPFLRVIKSTIMGLFISGGASMIILALNIRTEAVRLGYTLQVEPNGVIIWYLLSAGLLFISLLFNASEAEVAKNEALNDAAAGVSNGDTAAGRAARPATLSDRLKFQHVQYMQLYPGLK